MQFIKADKLTFDPRPQLGAIFVEGFYQWLKYFSKDKEKLSRAVSHMFNLHLFYVAVENGEIAAMTACSDGKMPSIRLERQLICKALGLVRGNFAYIMLKKHLTGRNYPFAFSNSTGSIEFVTTSEKHRGRGVAAGLITHVMNAMPYGEYVLEVADTNAVAMRLYERLGFREIMRTPAAKNTGLNYYVYMKREHNQSCEI